MSPCSAISVLPASGLNCNASMTDRIFKAYDVRAIYPDALNEDAAWKVGYATATYFQRSRQSGFFLKVRQDKTIVVGRDMRPHSPALHAALIDGIRATGTSVIDVGMVDTPFVYFAINHLDCVGGIQVTASHNPIEYNGFKISGAKARPIGAATGLEDIKRIAATLRVGKTGLQGGLEHEDLWSPYRRHVLPFLDLKRKLRVVVDASNGMAGWMVPAIFDKTPQLEILPLLFETEGAFVHDPDPMVTSNMRMLGEKVVSAGADLGICFDGDADRCGIVDEKGEAVRPDLVAALMARDVLASAENRGATVVYDLRCSQALPEVIAAAGGKPLRNRVGPAFIRKTMFDTDAVFGAEFSGHYYFRENYNADSGAITMARILSIISGQMMPVSELARPLQRYAHSGELNLHVEDKDARIRDLADKYRKGKIDYLDGITVNMGDWWFNVRKSNTEPLLRVNLECPDPDSLQQHLAELSAILGVPIVG